MSGSISEIMIGVFPEFPPKITLNLMSPLPRHPPRFHGSHALASSQDLMSFLPWASPQNLMSPLPRACPQTCLTFAQLIERPAPDLPQNVFHVHTTDRLYVFLQQINRKTCPCTSRNLHLTCPTDVFYVLATCT